MRRAILAYYAAYEHDAAVHDAAEAMLERWHDVLDRLADA